MWLLELLRRFFVGNPTTLSDVVVGLRKYGPLRVLSTDLAGRFGNLQIGTPLAVQCENNLVLISYYRSQRGKTVVESYDAWVKGREEGVEVSFRNGEVARWEFAGMQGGPMNASEQRCALQILAAMQEFCGGS